MMAAAVEEPHARPGMVAVIQSFGASLKWNPHRSYVLYLWTITPEIKEKADEE